MLHRRSLITGIAALIAAPSIVRASSLMPISGEIYKAWSISLPMLPPILRLDEAWEDGSKYFGPNGRLYEGTWTYFGKGKSVYSDELISFTKREYDY